MCLISLLEYSLDDTKVKSQNSGDVIEYVAANNNGFLLSWRFFRLHWDELYERLVRVNRSAKGALVT